MPAELARRLCRAAAHWIAGFRRPGPSQLLRRCLTAAQRKELRRTRAFTVRGASGRSYRIGFGTVANVEVLGDDGRAECRLCALPKGLPTPAVVLAQKLMLENHEADFLAVAARHPANLSRSLLGWPAQ